MAELTKNENASAGTKNSTDAIYGSNLSNRDP